jgi:hypothetical protein
MLRLPKDWRPAQTQLTPRTFSGSGASRSTFRRQRRGTSGNPLFGDTDALRGDSAPWVNQITAVLQQAEGPSVIPRAAHYPSDAAAVREGIFEQTYYYYRSKEGYSEMPPNEAES